MAALVVALCLLGPAESQPRSPTPTRAAVESGSSVRWLRTLERLDAARAAAWRRGDGAALRRVYLTGSSALQADRRMLREYRARGLRAAGVRLDIAAADVVDRAVNRVVLSTIDRLGSVRVRDGDGSSAVLPTDQPSRHTIVLCRGERGWRIAAVRLS